jgi:hypothetical protein
VWGSNPPGPAVPTPTGFEARGTHQSTLASACVDILIACAHVVHRLAVPMLQPRSKVSGFHASAFPPGTVLFVPQQAEKRTLSGELPFGKDLPQDPSLPLPFPVFRFTNHDSRITKNNPDPSIATAPQDDRGFDSRFTIHDSRFTIHDSRFTPLPPHSPFLIH